MLSFLPYRSTVLILPRSELANLAEPLFFLSFESILTVVGSVELWATRKRRPSAAANPQGFLVEVIERQGATPPKTPKIGCSADQVYSRLPMCR